MTAFYRIHADDNILVGMYSSYASENMPATIYEKECETKHPAPRNDSLLVKTYMEFLEASGASTDAAYIEIGGSGYYGFSSLDQMRRWVYQDEWLEQLDEEGFVISKFELEDVIVGNTQAIALRFVDAVPVKTVRCQDYKQLDEQTQHDDVLVETGRIKRRVSAKNPCMQQMARADRWAQSKERDTQIAEICHMLENMEIVSIEF